MSTIGEIDYFALKMTIDICRLERINATLMDYAKRNHEHGCEDCEGSGKIYNNADPSSGQWVACPVYELIEAEKVKP